MTRETEGAAQATGFGAGLPADGGNNASHVGIAGRAGTAGSITTVRHRTGDGRSPFILPPAINQALLVSGLVVALLATSLDIPRLATLGAAGAATVLVLAYPTAALVGLFVLSFGMLPAVLLPDALHDRMRNLVEVGLLGMAVLLALRAWLDPRIRIQYLVLPWVPFLVL